ncbi:MAG TPA: SidA/IucD/PvdA family monooxygenase, partial [Bradyrhizobium sp.]|nr:SidA/IucD/PvdA family monooxygenase [Bradyrhizobium sp.]
FRVSAESNRFGEEIYVCQNVVVAIGREPYLPPELRIDDPRVFHSAEFFSRLKRDDYPEDGTYVVVGAGQSAGEAARFLLARSPRSRVHVVSSGYLFRQVDDNPFVNDLYSNAMARDFFSLSRAERQRRLGDLRNTNYGVVDCAVLKELYRIGFDRKVMGLPGLSLHSYSNVKSVVPMANGLHVTIRALDGEESATIDNVNAVVAATGYADGRLKSILEGISVADGATDTVETDEHFEVKLSEGKGLFVVNHSRAAHGPTEGTMTALAERAQRIGDHLQFNIRGLTELRSTRRVTT